MTSPPIRTRFAPSPTGLLHLGNARTALFNALLASPGGGEFVLRIEDTDAERSRPEHIEALCRDLRWLGIDWQLGPDAGQEGGSYLQSQRTELYRELFETLEQHGAAYYCFCSEQELAQSRRAQAAAGRPPRYSGRCHGLSADEVATRLAEGQTPTLRFHVPPGQTVEIDDLVRGVQRFETDDIGDFIIRRSDGTPAFFFSNAVDDALMGITHVLRGEDHLANTPRQVLILRALGLRQPRYGHVALIVGPDGAPLSKRHGGRSLEQLREAGYLPEAVLNYLVRLGHHFDSDALLGLDALASQFNVSRLSRAPARYDAAQLGHWQRLAVQQLSDERMWQWLGKECAGLVASADRERFLAAVRPNIDVPGDALHWARVVYSDDWVLSDAALEAIRQAGPDFFIAGLGALDGGAPALDQLGARLKAATGRKGRALFHPLRAALTGDVEGPELSALIPLIGPHRVRKRFEDALKTSGG
jgi:nondiscriminating glutamyl-tRNA synthetase